MEGLTCCCSWHRPTEHRGAAQGAHEEQEEVFHKEKSLCRGGAPSWFAAVNGSRSPSGPHALAVRAGSGASCVDREVARRRKCAIGKCVLVQKCQLWGGDKEWLWWPRLQHWSHTRFYKPDTEISRERSYLIFCVCCLTVAEEQLNAACFLSAIIWSAKS